MIFQGSYHSAVIGQLLIQTIDSKFFLFPGSSTNIEILETMSLYKLFVLKIVTWSYNGLQIIIIIITAALSQQR